MTRNFQAILFTFAAAGLCFAQGQHGRPATAPAPALDMAKVQTVSGSVSAVAIGYGMRYPSITIGKVQIKIAPVWYLLDKNVEIKVGDVLSVQAAPATSASDPYLYAVEITDTGTNQRIVLRDVLGKPLWASLQTTAGAPAESACLLGPTAVASGTVDQIISGVGIQMPTLTLKTVDGSLLTIKIGPERVLLESDFELKAGEVATVKYASSVCRDELVALAVTNAGGQTVVLRNENGRPEWR